MKETYTVLPENLGGGPHGLGDPDDKTLRRVEKDVLIPKIMREKAKTDQDKCAPEVAAFGKCCKDSSYMMVVKCREETAAQKSCFEKWYTNEAFRAECTEIYLQKRSNYRANGKKSKDKKKESEMF